MSTIQYAQSDTRDPSSTDPQGPGGKGKRKKNPIARYVRWLHTQWPAGTVEKLPRVNDDGSTNVPGLYVVGDLTGIPLLKFSSDTGAKAVQRVLANPAFQSAIRNPLSEILDLVIVGAGVSGMAAALEAKKNDLRFEVLEAAEPFSTIVNFPKAKPIYTYPTDMTPAGDLQFKADVKEALVDELKAQTLAKGITPKIARAEKVTRADGALEVHLAPASPLNPEPQTLNPPSPLRARAVIIAIGRSGNFRMLNVPGEQKDKVSNRLHDPKAFADQNVLVVGGGDSAIETAIAIAEVGGRVTLSYRKGEFSRPKPDNVDRLNKLMADPMADVQIEKPTSERVNPAAGDFLRQYKKPGSIKLALSTAVTQIDDDAVSLQSLADGGVARIPNDAVFTMIGREAPLDFFRRSGVPINGDRGAKWWITLILFFTFCIFVYHWKKSGVVIADVPGLRQIARIGNTFGEKNWFPNNIPDAWGYLGKPFNNPKNILGVLKVSIGEGGFYYSLAYCALVTTFGIRRIKRRKTPYVKWQTLTLIVVQCLPLFLLPYILLPWMGNNGAFDHGFMQTTADALFPTCSYGHGREYWRSFGFILAWPLFFWNVFTSQPMWTWLIISLVQTFVIIPGIIYFWGKGAYCGWVCSCGALAETLGDAHRHKMPHGPFWNRLNLLGQGILVFAFVLLFLRVLAWRHVQWAEHWFDYLFHDISAINYVWFVDLFLAGIIGVGLYFHFSGRVWCRFACPLAALMHIYARFSRFRILADKKKCISCNVCTSVCHQGIDVMNFANKGMAMQDPECVRCSACVQSCPTGVLSFGQVDRKTGKTIRLDKLQASPVQMIELRHNGKALA